LPETVSPQSSFAHVPVAIIPGRAGGRSSVMRADTVLLRRVLWAGLTAGLCLIVARITLSPMVQVPDELPLNDKAYHAVAFGALVVPTAILEARWLIPVALAMLAYGGMIEIVQPFVGRTCDFRDFLADATGIGLVLLGSELGRRLLRRA